MSDPYAWLARYRAEQAVVAEAINARLARCAAGLPLLPGQDGAVYSVAELQEAAARLAQRKAA